MSGMRHKERKINIYAAGRCGKQRPALYILHKNNMLFLVKTANAAYVKKDLENSATLSVITDVSRLIHDTDGYTAGETEVAFVGNYNGGAKLSGFEELYGMFGSTYNLATPTGTSVERYYRFVLNERLNSCYPTEKILKSSDFAAMPCYPGRGCVGYVDGVLIVKFSS